MNAKRLIILADFLGDIPTEFAFDISLWGFYNPSKGVAPTRMQKLLTNQDITQVDAEFLFVECGYTACAIGHACMSHELRAEGLGYFISPGGSLTPLFKEDRDWGAVHAFFDIDEGTATYFFDESGYDEAADNYIENVTAKDVAERIKTWLNR